MQLDPNELALDFVDSRRLTAVSVNEDAATMAVHML